MLARVFACAVLLGAATAIAAPPEGAPVAAADIDVDALARAKDVDANAATVSDAGQKADTDASPAAADAQTPPAEDVEKGETGALAPPIEESSAVETGDEPEPSTATTSPPADVPSDVTSDSEEKRLAAACVARATSLLDAAEKGDYATATKDFDARMNSALSPAQFGEAWSSLAQFGKLKARGQSHPARSDGYVAVTIPLVFDKMNLYAQVACGADGRIAGFYVKPLQVPAQ